METDPTRTAMGRLAQDYSCAQAVLSAFGPRFGLEPEVCLRLAASFGVGFGLAGQ
jgi:hypothetical protein